MDDEKLDKVPDRFRRGLASGLSYPVACHLFRLLWFDRPDFWILLLNTDLKYALRFVLVAIMVSVTILSCAFIGPLLLGVIQCAAFC